MDNSIQIRCTRCTSNFREKAQKVQIGYSRQCPSCDVVIFFEESADKNIQKALRDAQNLRQALRREEETRIVGRAVVEPTEEIAEEPLVEQARILSTARNLPTARKKTYSRR